LPTRSRPHMALFGHTAMSDLSPLSGVKQSSFAHSEYFAF
jgi:hypothetical protein